MKKLLLLVTLASLAVSCQKPKESTVQGSDAFVSERKAFFNALLEPAEIAVRLQETAAGFNPGLLNDPEKYEAYIGNEVKVAANLGVYASDLNYVLAYSQHETSKAYFTATHELSKAIGVDRAVLAFLMKRYQDNIEQNDSIKTIATELWLNASRDFEGTERERLAGVAMSAYQIENLHLILGIIESYPTEILPDDARTANLIPLFKMVLNQRSNIVIIYNFLKTYSDPLDPESNPNYPYYALAFEELIEVYDRLSVEEKIVNNRIGELMNDAVVMELSSKVNAIRNKIIRVE